jgi:demethylmenaquinone methyltransferase/2-methoxy-6-polyprenyl-1,4-benzoquinol methylase
MQEYISSKEKKQEYVNQIFSIIAPRYDLVTSLLSYGCDQRWKRKLVAMASVEAHHEVLDLACGTGDITFLLAERLIEGRVLGVDIIPDMIEIANRKRVLRGVSNVSFQVADACCLNLAADSFDRITVGYGIRNVPDISLLLREVHRFLKPGGRFLSLDFSKPSNTLYREAYLRYLNAVGSFFGRLLHGDPVYRYIAESLRLYPGHHRIQEMMKAAGFVETGFITFLGGATAINFGCKSAAAPLSIA